MAKSYSMDLRERVAAAVEREGLSRHAAAARFGAAASSAIKWVQRYRATGSVAPGQIGGHKPRTLRGEHCGEPIDLGAHRAHFLGGARDRLQFGIIAARGHEGLALERARSQPCLDLCEAVDDLIEAVGGNGHARAVRGDRVTGVTLVSPIDLLTEASE